VAHRCSGGAGSGRPLSCEACNVRLTAPQSRLDLSGAAAGKIIDLAFLALKLGVGRDVSVAHVRPAAPDRDCDQARQGETTGVVRWVLGISLALAIVAMVISFLVF
jgi:hypothetical protein